MEWQQLITDIYVRTSQVLEKALEGLNLDDLNQQPRLDCNSDLPRLIGPPFKLVFSP